MDSKAMLLVLGVQHMSCGLKVQPFPALLEPSPDTRFQLDPSLGFSQSARATSN